MSNMKQYSLARPRIAGSATACAMTDSGLLQPGMHNKVDIPASSIYNRCRKSAQACEHDASDHRTAPEQRST